MLNHGRTAFPSSGQCYKEQMNANWIVSPLTEPFLLQVVSYSYLAAPQDSALSTTSHRSSNDVVYGSGSAAKPPGQLSASVVSVAPSKTASKPVAAAQTASKPVEAARTSHVSVAPATILTASSQNSVVAAPSSVHASISNAVPFGHSEASTFAVHHDTGAHHQVSHSAPQAFHGNAPAPPHAPASVLPANPSNFIIKDATFQVSQGLGVISKLGKLRTFMHIFIALYMSLYSCLFICHLSIYIHI